MTKNNIGSIALGFVLGTVTLLVLGQSQPPISAQWGRYHMMPFGNNSIAVQDSVTGTVKIILATDITREMSNTESPATTMDLGHPF